MPKETAEIMEIVKKIGNRKHRGFTLVEMVIAIVIMAILAAGISVMAANQISNAKYVTADSDLLALKGALDQYTITHNGTFIGLFANGKSEGYLTGPNALANMNKLDPFMSKPIATIYDPWQRPYRIWADYNGTTNQSDVVIYVEADTALGLNPKQVDYKTVTPNGTESTFTITNVAINPLRKAKGVAGSEGEPMSIRVSGQYEMQ
jgi:prepilin-type N-terminal cleavage/methylation domain-containing protein